MITDPAGAVVGCIAHPDDLDEFEKVLGDRKRFAVPQLDAKT